MKNLHFAYDMQIGYSENVANCHFTIKCIPRDTMRQKIQDVRISIEPRTSFCTGTDGLGNAALYGSIEEPHKSFHFHIEGTAVTGYEVYEEEEKESKDMIFRHPHGLNQPGEKIRKYYENLHLKQEKTSYDTAVAMMHALHCDFSYQPSVTSVNTSAEEAFELGCGVCQDYAHIYISLLHLAGVPARYVTGLIIGEGKSHAWVEILSGGKWYGLDPTNDCRAGEDYIRIGTGRDARDCMINRGIMHGGGLQIQEVTANVTEEGLGQ